MTSENNASERAIGYAGVARLLSSLAGRPVSRQGVWQWWHRRGRTGFPEGCLVIRTPGRQAHRVFDRDEVVVWWREHENQLSLRYSRKLFTPAAEGGKVRINEGQEPGRDEA